MSFITDQQTIKDLNLLGKYKQDSLFNIFNQVKTSGGERMLEELFRHPFTDPEAINQRSSIFKYFQDKQLKFPFQLEVFFIVENYLSMGSSDNYLSAIAATMRKKISGLLLRDDQFQIIYVGLEATIAALKTLRDFVNGLEGSKDTCCKEQLGIFNAVFADGRLEGLLEQQDTENLSLMKVIRYDYLLRHTLKKEMEQLLEQIYYLDVYIAVSDVARVGCFSYAQALPKAENQFCTKDLRHPAIKKGIGNLLTFNQSSNLLFLTGANMAGKSTFMKAFGIAVYLAHMGFPVAAKEMIFSVKDGIYSSINVPDNLNLGLSHFYAEVLRVKKVAEQVASGKDLVVIFDELFKGTNVKDAYDGTLSVTQAFSKYRNCFFIVSTHIIEVGDALRECADNIQLSYLPTVMEDNVPRYTYHLKEGITEDRQGMMIIQNEGILDIITKTKGT